MARHHSRSLSPERKRTSEGRQRRYGEDSENYRRKYHKSDRESGRARLGESRRERSRERSLKDQSRHHSSRRSERDDYDSERHKEKRARKDMGSLTIVPNPIISPSMNRQSAAYLSFSSLTSPFRRLQTLRTHIPRSPSPQKRPTFHLLHPVLCQSPGSR